jgi:hypothetical protein
MQSEEDLIEKMQIIIQFFLDILQVTVGEFAPEKCVWFLICHRWKNGKACLLTVQDSDRGITITSRATGTVLGMARKSPDEGHRTLGFQISMDGMCTAVIKEKSILYGEAIKSSSMWQGESGMAYNSFYMMSLGYGTPTTTLTIKECEDIHWPIVNAILLKMGIAWTSPRSMIFGTSQFGGLGLTNITAL